jgi:hypothetical protein
MVTRLILDTNVCGHIAASSNRVAIMRQLRSRYTIAASANTLFELSLGLCRSNRDDCFAADQERFRVAVGYGTLSHAKFLDHGLIFALSHGANLSVKETGTGKKMFRTYTTLVLKATNLQQLKYTGVKWSLGSQGRILKCDVIEADFSNAKLFYRNEICSTLPDQVTWAKNLGAVVGLNLNDAQARNLSDSLDGLYVYETWLRNAMRGTFKPENNVNDRMDMNQLFYLVDPSIEFITCEEKIRKRIAASRQSSRVVLLKELLQRETLAL